MYEISPDELTPLNQFKPAKSKIQENNSTNVHHPNQNIYTYFHCFSGEI
jgi:hypothetical protein